MLASAAANDQRVRHLRHDDNRGIVAASTTALEAASGEFIAMLDHDDVLAPNALARLVDALRDNPESSFAYSDNDVLRRDGRLVDPFFKPDFSPERLRNHNYVLHFVMAPAERVREAGGFRTGFDGAQDHDLLLRLSEIGPAIHVPEVLYHWREAPASVAANPAAKPYAYDAGVRAVQEHCDRVGIAASVAPGVADGVYRVRRAEPTGQLVSVVIPTRGTRAPVWGVDARARARGDAIDRRTLGLRSPQVRRRRRRRDAVRGRRRHSQRRWGHGHDRAVRGRVQLLGEGQRRSERRPATSCCSSTTTQNSSTPTASARWLRCCNGLMSAWSAPSCCTPTARCSTPGTCFPASPVTPCWGIRRPSRALPDGDRRARVQRCRRCRGDGSRRRVPRAWGLRRGPATQLQRRRPVVPDTRGRLPHRVDAARCLVPLRKCVAGSSDRDAERDLLLARWRERIEHDPYFNVNLAPHRTDWLERPGRSGAPPYYLDEDGRRRFS